MTPASAESASIQTSTAPPIYDVRGRHRTRRTRRLGMFCAQCGEQTLSTGQRFCHACGAQLPALADVMPYNAVGDGREPPSMIAGVSDRAIRAPLPARLALLAAGVTVAAIVAVALVMAIVAIVTTVLAALTPIVICIAVLYVLSRRRRRFRI